MTTAAHLAAITGNSLPREHCLHCRDDNPSSPSVHAANGSYHILRVA